MSIKIDDICTYAPKSGIKAGEATKDGQYMFFTSSEDESKRYTDYQYDGEGIIMGTGGNATLHYYHGKYAVSTDCIVLNPDDRIRCKYLYYFFLANMPILEAGFKGAGLKHTNKKYIGSITIPEIPSFDEQDRVVETLDKIAGIIKAREFEISALEELIKARFFEMFGDTFSNPMNWNQKSFKEVSRRLSDGPFGSNLKSEHYSEKGVRVIRLGNIGVGRFIDDDRSFVSVEHYESLKKYTCKAGEIVIGTLGEPNLRACIIPRDIEIAINKADCVHFIPKTELLNADFACQYINCPETLLLAQGMVHGQTRSRISSGQIAEMPIIVPPLELQQQFSNFVKQVSNTKEFINEALDSTRLLFDGLLHHCFG